MVQQSTLIQLITFAGLITPALAILIELLVQFHGGINEIASGKRLPIEIQLLFLGTGSILFGGMIVGIQFGLTIQNPITQTATLMIFIGLPLLVISLAILNLRISGVSDSEVGIVANVLLNFQYVLSITIPSLLSALLYLGPVYYFQQFLSSNFNWWIFATSLNPVVYFYAVAVFLLIKSIYSLWIYGDVPSASPASGVGDWFIIAFTVETLFLLLAAPFFAGYFFLLPYELPYISSTSLVSAVPFIWGAIVLLVIVALEIDPNEDES